MTDAVAVVSIRIGNKIGVRLWPRGARRIVGGIEFVEFDIGGDPEGELFAVGPDDLRPVHIRPIVIKTGIRLHGMVL